MKIAEQEMSWFCDNNGTIQAASKAGFGRRTKHVDVKLKCMRGYARNGTIALNYVSTEEQMAHIVTERLHKSVVTQSFEKVLSK